MRTVTMAALIVLFAAAICAADAPQMLSYQGVLTDAEGAVVPDGDYQITFAIYDVDVGGEALWQETQTVPVAEGIFDAMLGAIVPLDLPFDVAYWLSVSVGPEPELDPRTGLLPAPYAHYAKYAETSGADTDWVIERGNIYRGGGNVGIGTSNPTDKLHVVGGVKADEFRMPTGAADGYVLTSDAEGAGT